MVTNVNLLFLMAFLALAIGAIIAPDDRMLTSPMFPLFLIFGSLAVYLMFKKINNKNK